MGFSTTSKPWKVVEANAMKRQAEVQKAKREVEVEVEQNQDQPGPTYDKWSYTPINVDGQNPAPVYPIIYNCFIHPTWFWGL